MKNRKEGFINLSNQSSKKIKVSETENRHTIEYRKKNKTKRTSFKLLSVGLHRFEKILENEPEL